GGKIAVVLRADGAAVNTFDVAALNNPRLAQRRQPFLHLERNGFVAPGTAGVVNADWLVDFDFAGDRFRRGGRDFAEGGAQIGVEFAGDVDLLAVGQGSLDRMNRIF